MPCVGGSGREAVGATVRRGAVISELGASWPGFCSARSGRRGAAVLVAARLFNSRLVLERHDGRGRHGATGRLRDFRHQLRARRRGLGRAASLLEAEEL